MAPIPLEVAGTLLGLGTASGARASLTLLLIGVATRAGWMQVPEAWSFIGSTPMLGGMVAATIVEELLERDDDAQQLLGIVKYGLHGTGGLVVSYLLIEKLGWPLDGWPIAAVGAAFALLTHSYRMRLHETLRDIEAGIVSPRRWLSWLEAGGALGVTVAVLLSPLVAIGFVVVAAGLALVLALLLRAIEKLQRRPCPTCASKVRKEARLCPNCREALPVAKWRGDGVLSRLEQPQRVIKG